VVIRPARPGDEAALHRLLVENGLGHDGLDYTVWTHPCLVAVKDGEVVGMIQAALSAPVSIVTELAVARSSHRRGIGVRLAQHLETILRSQGVTAYVAHVAPENKEMQDQLERFGLVRVGEAQVFLRRLA
jgi:ribosomal protein S18 acetylase RimI-like enzyme